MLCNVFQEKIAILEDTLARARQELALFLDGSHSYEQQRETIRQILEELEQKRERFLSEEYSREVKDLMTKWYRLINPGDWRGLRAFQEGMTIEKNGRVTLGRGSGSGELRLSETNRIRLRYFPHLVQSAWGVTVLVPIPDISHLCEIKQDLLFGENGTCETPLGKLQKAGAISWVKVARDTPPPQFSALEEAGIIYLITRRPLSAFRTYFPLLKKTSSVVLSTANEGLIAELRRLQSEGSIEIGNIEVRS